MGTFYFNGESKLKRCSSRIELEDSHAAQSKCLLEPRKKIHQEKPLLEFGILFSFFSAGFLC